MRFACPADLTTSAKPALITLGRGGRSETAEIIRGRGKPLPDSRYRHKHAERLLRPNRTLALLTPSKTATKRSGGNWGPVAKEQASPRGIPRRPLPAAVVDVARKVDLNILNPQRNKSNPFAARRPPVNSHNRQSCQATAAPSIALARPAAMRPSGQPPTLITMVTILRAVLFPGCEEPFMRPCLLACFLLGGRGDHRPAGDRSSRGICRSRHRTVCG